MHTRSFIAASALLLAAVGCRDEAASPTEPGVVPQAHMAAATVLAFWQLSGGSGHTCGVATDSLAYCWGYNGDGQLGAGLDTGPERCAGGGGPFTNACSTRLASASGGGAPLRQVSTGLWHTCGVSTDYRAYWPALRDSLLKLPT